MSNYSGKESQYIYMVSRPGLGSDPSFGSGRESGSDSSDVATLTLSYVVDVISVDALS